MSQYFEQARASFSDEQIKSYCEAELKRIAFGKMAYIVADQPTDFRHDDFLKRLRGSGPGTVGSLPTQQLLPPTTSSTSSSLGPQRIVQEDLGVMSTNPILTHLLLLKILEQTSRYAPVSQSHDRRLPLTYMSADHYGPCPACLPMSLVPSTRTAAPPGQIVELGPNDETVAPIPRKTRENTDRSVVPVKKWVLIFDPMEDDFESYSVLPDISSPANWISAQIVEKINKSSSFKITTMEPTYHNCPFGLRLESSRQIKIDWRGDGTKTFNDSFFIFLDKLDPMAPDLIMGKASLTLSGNGMLFDEKPRKLQEERPNLSRNNIGAASSNIRGRRCLADGGRVAKRAIPMRPFNSKLERVPSRTVKNHRRP